MIPEPGKRPFNFPLPPEALEYFCHPTLEPFTQPVRHPEDGLIYAASGYFALRVRRLHAFAEEFPEASPEFVERVGTLNWSGFDNHARFDWRKVDDSRGTIYRDPYLPLWQEVPGKRHPQLTRDTIVETCEMCLLPVALLQLIARLPRPEVAVWGSRVGSYVYHLYVRSSVGEMIVPALYADRKDADIAFCLFKAKRESGSLETGFR